MPDIDGCILEWLAGACIEYNQAKRKRHAGLALDDVGAYEFIRNIERPFLLFRGEPAYIGSRCETKGLSGSLQLKRGCDCYSGCDKTAAGQDGIHVFHPSMDPEFARKLLSLLQETMNYR
jgi:hypothetical protein